MVEIILTQLRGQQSTHKGGLTTTLSAYKRRYTLIAVQHIHLQPMGHGRAEPDGEIVKLLRTDARYATKYPGDMVLSIPFG